MSGTIALKKAQELAGDIVKALDPWCESIEVAGSIRRRKPTVNDIDIVLVPKDWWELNKVVSRLGKVERSGEKMTRLILNGGVHLDIYYATPAKFATLFLIRTGSKENNIRLCSLAKKQGWRLFASGEGLFNERAERIAGDSEESIYKALGIAYQEPWERG